MSDRKLFQCKITDISLWNIMDLDFQGCLYVPGAFACAWSSGYLYCFRFRDILYLPENLVFSSYCVALKPNF